ncbi:MAG: hypothetical protein BIFFINMI_00900 [Phycisphaerae bacterium]|nr:hypothetical protein [Phycisphaerae bacterium]
MRILPLIVAGVLATSTAIGAGGSAAAAQPREPILQTGSYWRVHAACRDAVVPVELVREQKPDATEPLLLAG